MLSLTPRRPIAHAVSTFYGKGSSRWKGPLHIRCVGKTGETLYAHGVIPALRQVLPQAQIVWHSLERYLPVRHRLLPEFHADVYTPLEPGEGETTALIVQDTVIKHAHSGYDVRDDGLWVDIYRTHPWYVWDVAARAVGNQGLPFYRLFATAVGLLPGDYRFPQPVERIRGYRVALVLPATNEHCAVRSLRFSPKLWKQLAKRWYNLGLQPVVNVFCEDAQCDPAILDAGFTPNTGTGYDTVLDLVSHAGVVLGLNSGMTFAHMLLGPQNAETFMVDPQGMPIYSFARMRGLVGEKRHQFVLWQSNWPVVESLIEEKTRSL